MLPFANPADNEEVLMNRTALLALLLPCLAALLLPAAGADNNKEKPDDTGFVSIFDGKTLEGWHVSAKSGHSRASKNKTGGRWVVEDGAIVGSQDIRGNGGLIITDKAYGDFEAPASTSTTSSSSIVPKRSKRISVLLPCPYRRRSGRTSGSTISGTSCALASSAIRRRSPPGSKA
jgi:hypothetical protein